MTVRAKAFLQTLVFLILVGIALFGAAGRFEFAEFWIYIAIIATISAVSLAILDADLIAERMRPGGKRVGRRFLPVMAILLVHWVLAGLDRGRLHLHDEVPLPLRISGLIGFAAGWALFVWAMQVNRYFSSIPRIQAERGHRVVAEGPYRWVRHPGYAGALLAAVFSPLALGSWLSAFLVPVAAALLAWRIAVEEQLLTRELPGYTGYAGRVRYRLIPGLW
jgi:protein-S-isoprenylcysteine O-methyltransferase Ste14